MIKAFKKYLLVRRINGNARQLSGTKSDSLSFGGDVQHELASRFGYKSYESMLKNVEQRLFHEHVIATANDKSKNGWLVGKSNVSNEFLWLNKEYLRHQLMVGDSVSTARFCELTISQAKKHKQRLVFFGVSKAMVGDEVVHVNASEFNGKNRAIFKLLCKNMSSASFMSLLFDYGKINGLVADYWHPMTLQSFFKLRPLVDALKRNKIKFRDAKKFLEIESLRSNADVELRDFMEKHYSILSGENEDRVNWFVVLGDLYGRLGERLGKTEVVANECDFFEKDRISIECNHFSSNSEMKMFVNYMVQHLCLGRPSIIILNDIMMNNEVINSILNNQTQGVVATVFSNDFLNVMKNDKEAMLLFIRFWEQAVSKMVGNNSAEQLACLGVNVPKVSHGGLLWLYGEIMEPITMINEGENLKPWS